MNGLHSDMRQLRKQAAALGWTDTERLEWLSQQLSSVSSRPGKDSTWKLFFVSPVEPRDFQVMTLGNFQAAIDAAMDAEEQG